MHLDEMPLEEAIALMLSEEARVAKTLLSKRASLARAVRMIVQAFRRRGRLFYVGAGTSGRLGALDASECPPTFRTPTGMVQAIIAGGRKALWRSVEGAEDDAQAGHNEIVRRGIESRDAVVGIAASGTTPFVWGALRESKCRKAATILICFNPFLKIPRTLRPDLVIAPNLGPEVLTGSTRLKAGTATKVILNVFSTLAMVQLDKVRSNLMVDLHPTNAKLRNRAVRIVRELIGAGESEARRVLERNGWIIKKATAPRDGRQTLRIGEICPADKKR